MSLVIWLAALLSGGAAIAYEICWSRALAVPLGNSADATGMVLAGFMAGIAVGSWVSGAIADRVRSPLRWYGLAELLLAGFALAAPLLIARLDRLPAGPGSVVRLGAAGLLVVVPCLSMGASMPLLVRALSSAGGTLRTRIGLTYGLNTAGAAVSAILTGFWGIATHGVQQSSALAAMASLAAAVLALGASSRLPAHAPPVPSAETKRTGGSLDRGIAVVAALLGGFAMLASEVLWARLLTFVFGHDTYAFASLLAIVLVGLALGGLAHRLTATRDQRLVTGALLSAFAATLLVSFHAAASLMIQRGRDPFGLDATRALATSVHLELYRELAYTPWLVLVPSVLAGALLPAACALHGRSSSEVGRSVGVVGLVNGLGAAAGALVAAFGLVAVAGIQWALVLLSWLCCAGAAAIALFMPSSTASSAIRTRVSLAALFALPTILATIRMPDGLPRRMLLRAVGDRHQTLLYYEEARTGTVSVTLNRINGEKVLMMNAVNEVTTRQVHDESFKLLGHLAPLLHPAPHRGVMICLGAGLSAGAATLHPLDRLDVVDLSSAIPRAARLFSRENHGVLDLPAFRLHVDDGRQYLLNSDGGYDVAIVDSTHPKSVDSWILYTKEFYELLRDKLAPGGIAVQWLPLHGLSEQEFKIVVRTFLSVFDHTTLWANVGFETYGQVGYAKLVGSRDRELHVDVERLAERLARPEIQQDLKPYGMATVEEVVNLFVAGPERLRPWTEGLPEQTDDLPMVPYTTRYSVGRGMAPSLLLAVRSWPDRLLTRGSAPDPGWEARMRAAWDAQGLVIAGMPGRAAELYPALARPGIYVAQQATTLGYYEQLAAWYAGDADRQFEAATQMGAMGHAPRAVDLFEHALRLRRDDFRVRLNMALALAQTGRHDRAMAMLTRLRDEQPGSAIVLHNLGAVLLSSGHAEEAIPHLRQAIAWDPEALGARQSLAEALLLSGQPDAALAEARRILAANSWVAEAWEVHGLAAQAMGDREGALRSLTKAVELNGYRVGARTRLADALRSAGRLDDARQHDEVAVRIDPRAVAAVMGLARIELDSAHYEQAADLYVRALDIDAGLAAAAYGLGRALQGQGRQNDAVQAFCLAVRLNGRFMEARHALEELGSVDCGP